MNTVTLIFSALGLAGLGIVGLAVKELYLNVEKVPANAAVRVMSSIFAVFVLVIGTTLAGLALSYVLTKEWSAIPHFMLLACLCGVSVYFQLKPARKLVASAAQAAPARVEPTAVPVTEVVTAVAPASAEQSASASPGIDAAAVAATTVAVTATAASEVDEASLPDAPPPAVVSAIADADLDAWTPEEEVAAPAEPLAVPANAAPSFNDEAADVLDLNGVTKVPDALDTVHAEQRVDGVEPASGNEAAMSVVASPSDISVAVA